ncbi:hypothetical protein EV202_10330 [Bacteroides heparinolyticus]|uniref:Uncharacterized protein n=1 Tax=Prevotella heparinolytica TaxID=28113 RepID=A0A4V2SF21_9BACE|nr:hypothetical protein EV202_10330 [Bacteroides heparinolyticus]
MTVFIKCPGLAQQLRTNLQPTACQLRAGSELTSNSETAPKEHKIQYINRFTLFIPFARERREEKRRKYLPHTPSSLEVEKAEKQHSLYAVTWGRSKAKTRAYKW